MMKSICAAAMLAAATGLGAQATAAELTEDDVRRIAEEVARKVVEEYMAGDEQTFEIEFTEEFLNDPEHIEAGREIWVEQCALCHGASAYPGKAPKLKPKRYTPEFVYDRITNGFRKMPAWKDVYSDEERMDLVAWIKSRHFRP